MRLLTPTLTSTLALGFIIATPSNIQATIEPLQNEPNLGGAIELVAKRLKGHLVRSIRATRFNKDI